MELTKVQLGAVVEIDEKHARKVIRMFNDLLDSLPGRIANVEVLERTAKVEGNSTDGKQVPRPSASKRRSYGPAE